MRKEIKHEHESYGMVSIGHINSTGMTLFGSGVEHNNAISLEIHEADKTSDEFHSAYFPKKLITKIYLSPAQFTGMLTKMNTTGVPCTLKYVKHEGSKELCPKMNNTKAKLLKDLEERYQKLANELKFMEKDVDMFLEGNVRVGDKKNIKRSVAMMIQEVEKNLPYLAECQTETLEKVGSEVVAEAEASISGLINARGLQALKLDAKNNKLIEL